MASRRESYGDGQRQRLVATKYTKGTKDTASGCGAGQRTEHEKHLFTAYLLPLVVRPTTQNRHSENRSTHNPDSSAIRNGRGDYLESLRDRSVQAAQVTVYRRLEICDRLGVRGTLSATPGQLRAPGPIPVRSFAVYPGENLHSATLPSSYGKQTAPTVQKSISDVHILVSSARNRPLPP